MIAVAAQVQDGQSHRSMSRRQSQSPGSPFERIDFLLQLVYRGVADTRIDMCSIFQIEHIANLLGGIEFVGGTLNDPRYAGFGVFRLVAVLNGTGANMKFFSSHFMLIF